MDFFLLLTIQASAQPEKKSAVQVVKVEVERQPDLNIPRARHTVFSVNGEITVAGGHTEGFVPI